MRIGGSIGHVDITAGTLGGFVTRGDGSRYAVKVNLAEEPTVTVPTMVDGVPIIVRVLGTIRKQAT